MNGFLLFFFFYFLEKIEDYTQIIIYYSFNKIIIYSKGIE